MTAFFTALIFAELTESFRREALTSPEPVAAAVTILALLVALTIGQLLYRLIESPRGSFVVLVYLIFLLWIADAIGRVVGFLAGDTLPEGAGEVFQQSADHLTGLLLGLYPVIALMAGLARYLDGELTYVRSLGKGPALTLLTLPLVAVSTATAMWTGDVRWWIACLGVALLSVATCVNWTSSKLVSVYYARLAVPAHGLAGGFIFGLYPFREADVRSIAVTVFVIAAVLLAAAWSANFVYIGEYWTPGRLFGIALLLLSARLSYGLTLAFFGAPPWSMAPPHAAEAWIVLVLPTVLAVYGYVAVAIEDTGFRTSLLSR